MTHRISLLLAALALVTACFNPEDPGPLDEPAGSSGGETDDEPGQDAGSDDGAVAACLDLEQPCSQGLDCCGYDPEFPAGSTQCVQVDEVAACTVICFGPDDCDSGCCAALEGIEAYGACVEASFCAGS